MSVPESESAALVACDHGASYGNGDGTRTCILTGCGVTFTPEPRVEVDRYVVYPTAYDDLVHSDKDSWCLTVVNGHAWGWKITRGRGSDSGMAMNRRGEWIFESRGSKRNKPRRWPLDEALRIAVEHVDTHRLNGCTAVEASAEVAARLAQAGARLVDGEPS